MKLQTWTLWAIAVTFVSTILQLAALFLIRTPVWSLVDVLAQAVIWAAVLLFAIAIRPSQLARALTPDSLYVGLSPKS